MKYSGGPLDNQTWQTEWKTDPFVKVQLCEKKRKKKGFFESFRCGEPFWLSSGPPECFTFSYCAWLWFIDKTPPAMLNVLIVTSVLYGHLLQFGGQWGFQYQTQLFTQFLRETGSEQLILAPGLLSCSLFFRRSTVQVIPHWQLVLQVTTELFRVDRAELLEKQDCKISFIL